MATPYHLIGDIAEEGTHLRKTLAYQIQTEEFLAKLDLYYQGKVDK